MWFLSTLYSMFGPLPKTEAQEKEEARKKAEAMQNTALIALGLGVTYLGYRYFEGRDKTASLSELSPSHARLLAMADDLEEE
jgi:hypothetical protein